MDEQDKDNRIKHNHSAGSWMCPACEAEEVEKGTETITERSLEGVPANPECIIRQPLQPYSPDAE
jgi:hypothetical protein